MLQIVSKIWKEYIFYTTCLVMFVKLEQLKSTCTIHSSLYFINAFITHDSLTTPPYKGNFSSRFSRNNEAFASEYFRNISSVLHAQCCPNYYFVFHVSQGLIVLFQLLHQILSFLILLNSYYLCLQNSQHVTVFSQHSQSLLLIIYSHSILPCLSN